MQKVQKTERKWRDLVFSTPEHLYKGLLFSLVGLLLILSLNIKAIFAVMKTSEAVMKVRPENSGLYGMWTSDLCNTGAVLYLLS